MASQSRKGHNWDELRSPLKVRQFIYFGPRKGLEDLALPTGLGSQWGRIILEVINGLDKTQPPSHVHLVPVPTIFVNFKLMLLFKVF